MLLLHRLTDVFGGKRNQPLRARQSVARRHLRGHRLIVESLEIRSLLSTVTNGLIAFDRFGGDDTDLWSIQPNGDGPENIQDNTTDDADPAWSPDGTQIAFNTSRDGNWEIYLQNADGSQQRLTYDERQNLSPAWSPDGNKIAFSSYDGWHGDVEIYVIERDTDGVWGTPTNLTNYAAAGDFKPSWSPDGKIVFNSYRDGNGEVYVMNADGSSPTRLTTTPEDDHDAAWSPDGSKIAFTKGTVGDPSTYEVYVMNADGSGQTNLTQNTMPDFEAAWSPDGSKIAFSSDRFGDRHVFVMDADGTTRPN